MELQSFVIVRSVLVCFAFFNVKFLHSKEGSPRLFSGLV